MEKSNLRKIVIQLGFTLVVLVLLGRLFVMQVMDSTYAAKAKNNVVREITVYPSRGLIKDRNGKLVVNNEAVYDLMMIPRRVSNLDTTKLCKLLDISREDFDQYIIKMKRSRGYSSFKPQPFYKQIPADIYARLQEYLYQFPGFFPQVRTIRSYPGNCAAHILGYIGEVNQTQIDTSDYYRMGDYVGISGIEKTYEEELRGVRGLEHVIVDVHNREIGNYSDMNLNKDAVAGKDLTLTLDIDLQTYAEELMKNKIGSVVAIEPNTGELLALVSSPTYDPNAMTGRNRGSSMKSLQADPLKPLFNRALMANYPPGSIFKPLMALLALDQEIIHPNYYYGCSGGYRLGSLTVGCHNHTPCYNVQEAIKHSCNAYFCHIFKLFIEQNRYNHVSTGLTFWQDYLNQFGLGVSTRVDLPNAKKGKVPGPDLYNRMYGDQRWRASMIISLGIGQGELGITPLQMATMTAAVANRGHYFYPHVVKPFENDSASIYKKRQEVGIAANKFNSVIDGMERVILSGTGTVAWVQGMDLCGKTGTVENPHGDDHSTFIAFAPKDDPKIAIAVVVENGGWGSSFAAPISSLVIEKYLNKGQELNPRRQWLEDKMKNANLLVPKSQRYTDKRFLPKPKYDDLSF